MDLFVISKKISKFGKERHVRRETRTRLFGALRGIIDLPLNYFKKF